MIAYSLKCSKCKSTADYCERTGHALYETAEIEGWIWRESVGWLCSQCEFMRITKPVAQRLKQAALI